MIMAFLQMIAGAFVAFVFGVAGIQILAGAHENVSNSGGVFWFTFVLFSGGVALFFMGRRRRRVYKAHKRYTHILSSLPISSLEELAAATKEPVASLVSNINQMRLLRLPLSFSAFPPEQSAPSVPSPTTSIGAVNTAPAFVNVKCAGCGANNRVTPGAACVCEYCGSPLLLS